MSMLTNQVDNLREQATRFEGYQNGDISAALREAADTIESLRERAQAATLGKQTWRNSYDQKRYDRWYNSLFHGEPSSFKELIEDVIWTTETVDLGPNGNECQGVDEGEVNTDSLIMIWAEKAATLGSGERTCHADEVTHRDCKYSVDRGWKERTCKQEERGWGTEGDHARVWLTCGHDCMVETVQDLPNYCPHCGAKVVSE